MTVIAAVETVRVHAALRRPFVTAVRRTDSIDAVIVRVRDSDGRCGWGEASDNPRVTGETLESVEALIGRVLGPVVIGRDPSQRQDASRAIAGAVHGNPSARSALDCGVHDLAAQQLGVPLATLLGGRPRVLRSDATLSVGAATDLADEAAGLAGQGFEALKLKLDGHDDLERCRRVAAAAPGVLLRLDANQAWTPKQAVTLITALEDAGVPLEFVEQPVAARDLAGLAWVTERVSTPILADESVWDARDVLEIARTRAADLVNLKLAKCGGIGPAGDFLATAEACGLGVVFGSMMETAVGAGAAASVAAALAEPSTDDGELRTVDLDPPWLLRASPLLGGPRFDGPTITLLDAPGLGIVELTDAHSTGADQPVRAQH